MDTNPAPYNLAIETLLKAQQSPRGGSSVSETVPRPQRTDAPPSRTPGSTATGIRTRVSAMRGRRPSPLDDSGARSTGTRLAKRSEQVPPGLSASEAFIAAPPSRSARAVRVRYLRLLVGTRIDRKNVVQGKSADV